jgi:hypothetical protein
MAVPEVWTKVHFFCVDRLCVFALTPHGLCVCRFLHKNHLFFRLKTCFPCLSTTYLLPLGLGIRRARPGAIGPSGGALVAVFVPISFLSSSYFFSLSFSHQNLVSLCFLFFFMHFIA